METVEKLNKDLVSHKLLDKKVLSKQNGRTGKICVVRLMLLTQSSVLKVN